MLRADEMSDDLLMITKEKDGKDAVVTDCGRRKISSVSMFHDFHTLNTLILDAKYVSNA